MKERLQLAITSQIAHRLLFPQRFVAADIVENRWVQNKEATVYPTGLSYRFFDKGLDRISIEAQGAKTCSRMCRRHGCDRIVGFVEREQSIDFYVGNTTRRSCKNRHHPDSL